ncbi:hypothetical protein AURDEDRAFT_188877 [Auricularia subglabra TFB-10046 SS5]|nr:hypothetical protein AURDEDRAFT_188877 [Auricularia subglabra TFB-10046 SS5]
MAQFQDAAPLFPQPQPPPAQQPQEEEDSELGRVWALVSDLGEQLARNRALAASLQSQAGHIKSQAFHAQSGFPLRRFNADLPKEVYEEELARLTRAMHVENKQLAGENKQLSILVREYEATLEAVMGRFRQAAMASQERELELARSFERALLARDDRLHAQALDVATSSDALIARLSALLRAAVRANNGEPDPDGLEQDEEQREGRDGDWALDRDCELARLERENAELRRMLGAPVPDYPYDMPPPAFRSATIPTRRFPPRASGLGVYTQSLGPGMGIGMQQASPIQGNMGEWSPSVGREGMWRDREALLG